MFKRIQHGTENIDIYKNINIIVTGIVLIYIHWTLNVYIYIIYTLYIAFR